VAVAGCGKTAATSPGDASSDALPSGDAGEDAAAVDAEQDPGVYPARHHPLPQAQNLGGAILAAPAIATVTFKNDPLITPIWDFGDQVVGGTWWPAVAKSFGLMLPTSLGGWELDETGLTGRTLDDVVDFQPWIATQVNAGLLPKPTSQTLYVFYLPSDVAGTHRHGYTTCNEIGGYHDSAEVRLSPVSAVNVAYAVVGRCTTSIGDLTVAASHEIFEAASDANPASGTGFYVEHDVSWTGPGGDEVADICQGRGAPVVVAGSTYARMWSNLAANAGRDPCQPTPSGELYYQTAVDTEAAAVTDPSGPSMSDGYVVMKRGTTRTVHATTYSEAALPNDVALVAGKPNGGTDPTVVDPIAPGVTATLSRKTAHNGNDVDVTLAVDATTTAGDYPFVVRSILDATTGDFHSWPVILRVE
jgi:hypothetical protein